MTPQLRDVIECFERNASFIDSDNKTLRSDDVLSLVREDLVRHGFQVESGKRSIQKIPVPVLFGRNNEIDKSYNADALSADGKIVIEVEAGRATANNQYMKDIFQACLMHGVEYLVIAVRRTYTAGNSVSKDFEKIERFLETLYISSRLRLPLKGILVVGY